MLLADFLRFGVAGGPAAALEVYPSSRFYLAISGAGPLWGFHDQTSATQVRVTQALVTSEAGVRAWTGDRVALVAALGLGADHFRASGDVIRHEPGLSGRSDSLLTLALVPALRASFRINGSLISTGRRASGMAGHTAGGFQPRGAASGWPLDRWRISRLEVGAVTKHRVPALFASFITALFAAGCGEQDLHVTETYRQMALHIRAPDGRMEVPYRSELDTDSAFAFEAWVYMLAPTTGDGAEGVAAEYDICVGSV